MFLSVKSVGPIVLDNIIIKNHHTINYILYKYAMKHHYNNFPNPNI